MVSYINPVDAQKDFSETYESSKACPTYIKSNFFIPIGSFDYLSISAATFVCLQLVDNST